MEKVKWKKGAAGSSTPKNRCASLEVNVSADECQVQSDRARCRKNALGDCAAVIVDGELERAAWLAIFEEAETLLARPDHRNPSTVFVPEFRLGCIRNDLVCPD